MRTIHYTVVCLVALTFIAYGCNSSATNQPAGSDAAGQTSTEDAHADHGAGGQTDMDKMKAELAKLPPEDAASAEQQHMCPVSGEMLGTMGPPQKIAVQGQPVWICCAHCKDELLANPDKYLARLKKD